MARRFQEITEVYRAGTGRTGPWGQVDGVPALRMPEL